MIEQTKAQDGAIPYLVEETRVHAKNAAPAGRIFLVIRFETKDKKYTNYRAIPLGFTREQKAEICEILWSVLVNKFDLHSFDNRNIDN